MSVFFLSSPFWLHHKDLLSNIFWKFKLVLPPIYVAQPQACYTRNVYWKFYEKVRYATNFIDNRSFEKLQM